jgi:hypothetical protein
MKSHTLDLRTKQSHVLEYIGGVLLIAGWMLFFTIGLPLLLEPQTCAAADAHTVVCQSK